MYETSDLYLAAALQETGHPLASVWKSGTRSTFEFQDTASLQGAIAQYFAGGMQVPAHAYAERIRSAKSMAVNAPTKVAS
jgi:hypothetical protein